MDQLSLAVEEVLRWPGVVAQRPPDRELIVDRDRIRQPLVANPTVDVLGAFTELELRRVDPDHDQAERGVLAIPRLDIGQGTNPVDAGVLADIDQYHLATQPCGAEWRRVHPALTVKAGNLPTASTRHEPATTPKNRTGRMVFIDEPQVAPENPLDCGRLKHSLNLRVEIPPTASQGRHLTTSRPLAGASPAEESLSSGFAEGGQRLLSAHLRFRQDRLEA